MHNIWLIAKREYLERIHAKSFLIMTIRSEEHTSELQSPC